MNLFVANISLSVNEEALKALFSESGQVLSVKIVSDKVSGNSKGFGFVEMANETQGQQAVKKLSSASFFGKNLIVSKARPETF